MDFLKHINYDNCITNFTSSIQKNYGIKPNYKTNEIVDNLLKEKDYQNVLVFLFDGMGNEIIDKNTTEASFLREHRVSKMVSTYPPTTANCTTAFQSGLNPITSGWLGWTTYFKELNQCIDNYPNVDTLTKESVGNENVANKIIPFKHLGTSIEEATNNEVKYYQIMPNDIDKKHGYKSLDDMFHRAIKLCNQPGKKYIYVYYEDPDYNMHVLGTKNDVVKAILNKISKGLKSFNRKTKDTIGFVVADHGQIDTTPIALYTYYDVMECLRLPFSCDSRTPFFFVKEGYEEKFVNLFNKYFKDSFVLLSKKEVLESNIFGTGSKHPLFESMIGDYVGFATSHYYFMLSSKSHNFKGHHAGTTLDEMSIPLIVIKN